MLEGTGDKEKQEIALKAAISGLRKHSCHLFCNENAIVFFFAVKDKLSNIRHAYGACFYLWQRQQNPYGCHTKSTLQLSKSHQGQMCRGNELFDWTCQDNR